mmetsp:Transcript_126739/g.354870  ORF Transcript_126739/g.354870 Transcript_126739/m.354870 type:complete len:205 (+) Transcript_126739:3-617(+)
MGRQEQRELDRQSRPRLLSHWSDGFAVRSSRYVCNCEAHPGVPRGFRASLTDSELVQRAMQEKCITTAARLHAVRLLFDGRSVGKATLVGVVFFFLVFTGPVVGLKLLGFSAAGIVKGSVAASIQATFPLISSGSWFAMAQSASATGAVWFPMTSAVVGGLGSWITLGGEKLMITSDWQLFGLVLKYSLVDDTLRDLLHRSLAT